MSEKTHDPTPQKLEDARKKGQVPSSRDFAKCLIIWPVAEVAFAMEAECRRSLSQLFDLALRWNESNFQSLLLQTLSSSLWVLLLPAAIFALMVPLLATFGFWGQFGVLIAPESLTPDLSKLDPMAAAKNLFSPKKLKEIGLSLLKLILICTLSWMVVRAELASIVSLAGGRHCPHLRLVCGGGAWILSHPDGGDAGVCGDRRHHAAPCAQQGFDDEPGGHHQGVQTERRRPDDQGPAQADCDGDPEL
jgi:flagellar biosynthesis protein FlhB